MQAMNNEVFAFMKIAIRIRSLPQLTSRAAEVRKEISDKAHIRGLQARLPSSCEANPFKMKKCKLEVYERIESGMCALLGNMADPHFECPIQDLNPV